MIEEWRIVDEFPEYEVSNKGRVRKNGEYIGYFESCQDASRKTGVNDRHITECCLFKRKSARGFIWRRDIDYSLYSTVI